MDLHRPSRDGIHCETSSDLEEEMGKCPGMWRNYGFGGLTIVSCGTSLA